MNNNKRKKQQAKVSQAKKTVGRENTARITPTILPRKEELIKAFLMVIFAEILKALMNPLIVEILRIITS